MENAFLGGTHSSNLLQISLTMTPEGYRDVQRLKKENETLGKKLASYGAELKNLRDPKEPVKNALNESNSRLEQENAVLRVKVSLRS